MFGIKEKSLSVTELLNELNQANQQIGKLESDKQHREEKINRLKHHVSTAESKITELTTSLVSRDRVVKDTFGINLERMIPTDNNNLFISEALQLLKGGLVRKYWSFLLHYQQIPFFRMRSILNM
jgi:predicted nuclease with TOPRIM domain